MPKTARHLLRVPADSDLFAIDAVAAWVAPRRDQSRHLYKINSISRTTADCACKQGISSRGAICTQRIIPIDGISIAAAHRRHPQRPQHRDCRRRPRHAPRLHPSPEFHSHQRAIFRSAPNSPTRCCSNMPGPTTRAFPASSPLPRTWEPRSAASAPISKSLKKRSYWRSNNEASARPTCTGFTSPLSLIKVAAPDRQILPFKSGNSCRS